MTSCLCLICVRRGIQRGRAVCAFLRPVLLGSFSRKGPCWQGLEKRGFTLRVGTGTEIREEENLVPPAESH